MFESKGCKIKADLDKSVSHGTLRTEDLVPVLMEVLEETPEYNGIKSEFDSIVDLYRFSGLSVWDSYEICEFLNETLDDLLNEYAPEGYRFGALEGDGSDFGFWKVESEPFEDDEDRDDEEDSPLKYKYYLD